MNNNRNGNFWIGFFLGGLIGGFIIFVLGTKEGKKLAERIVDKAELYEEELEENVAKLQKKGEDLLKEAQTVKDQVVEKLENERETVSAALVTKLDQTLTHIEDVQKKGVALTEEIHHRYFRKNGKPLVS